MRRALAQRSLLLSGAMEELWLSLCGYFYFAIWVLELSAFWAAESPLSIANVEVEGLFVGTSQQSIKQQGEPNL